MSAYQLLTDKSSSLREMSKYNDRAKIFFSIVQAVTYFYSYQEEASLEISEWSPETNKLIIVW